MISLWCKQCEDKNGWYASKRDHIQHSDGMIECSDCGFKRKADEQSFATPSVLQKASRRSRDYPQYNSSIGQTFKTYEDQASYAKKNKLEAL